MKQSLILAIAVSLLLPALPSPLLAATTNEEQQLILVLQSNCPPNEKDAACAKLKRIGTARSVPALSALLRDDQLSHSARYALESMRCTEADQALRAALRETSELTKVGIINSLGMRRDTKAVPALAKLLADPNSAVAAAAATALGQTGGPAALKALQAVLNKSTGSVHAAVVNSTLRCANTLLASGNRSKALPVFERLYETETPDYVRAAAYRGMILASGKEGLAVMAQAITGPAGPSQTAALQLVHDIAVPAASKTFAGLLPKVGESVQVALIEGLAQRRDTSAAQPIAALATSPTPQVRLAAVKALGILGDAATVPLLAGSAASATGDEQKAARQSLVELRGGQITETLFAELTTAQPAVQAESARALGERGDKAAVPRLLQLAKNGPDSARKAGLQALALLAEESQLASLVQLVLGAREEAARAEAAEALNSACQRIQTARGRVNVEPLVQGLANGSPDARVALLPVCSGLSYPQVRAALQAAVADSDPKVRVAAVRALCDTTDAQLLPDLLKVACRGPEENLRSVAINGCVRLATQEEGVKLSNLQKLDALKAILATPLRDDQKRVVLAGLAEVPDLEALKLVELFLNDAAVQSEAARAVIKLGPALPGPQAQAAATLLKKLLASTTDSATHQAAETALKEIEAPADFITVWRVAGPYRQAGKDFAALFDIPFAPETANAQRAKWRPLPVSNHKRPWLMDLLKALGGEQCVAYAHTWIRSDQEQAARLDVGTDDGVKIWLNDKVVHANNVARGLEPGSDKVNVTLKRGWNSLLLKITQNTAGWGFCACLVKPDGSHLEGLQIEADPEKVRPPQTKQ